MTLDAGGPFMSDPDAARRIREAQSGDFRGMDPIYDELLPAMVCWLRGHAHDPRVAQSIEDEFVSDLTLKTLDKIDAFVVPATAVLITFRGWAMSMARLTLLEVLRRGGRQPGRLHTSVELRASMTSVVTSLHKAQWFAELAAAMHSLGAEDGQLLARRLEGVPIATLAAESGERDGTLRMRLKRLRDALGERLVRRLGNFDED